MVVYEVIKSGIDCCDAGNSFVVVASFSNRESAGYVRESLSKRDRVNSYFVESRAVHTATVKSFLDSVVQEIEKENLC